MSIRSGRRRMLGALAAVAAFLFAAVPADAAVKRCGVGLYAGENTSCQLAKALFKVTGRSEDKLADGQTVAVRSAVTGKTYAFHLYRGDRRSFTARAQGDGLLSVRIDY